MQALPRIATAVSSNPDAYVYLAESIRAWPDQAKLAHRIADAGWSAVAVAQPHRRHRGAARRDQAVALKRPRWRCADVRSPDVRTSGRSRQHDRHRSPFRPAYGRRSCATCSRWSFPAAGIDGRRTAGGTTGFCRGNRRRTRAHFSTCSRSPSRSSRVSRPRRRLAGADENDVTLYISRPDASDGALPCAVHLHGGAMAFLSAADTGYMRGREYLAATGLVVVGVEFRNSGGKLGPYPYPAGLNDCVAAVRSVATNRAETRFCPFGRGRGVRRRQSRPRCSPQG